MEISAVVAVADQTRWNILHSRRDYRRREPYYNVYIALWIGYSVLAHSFIDFPFEWTLHESKTDCTRARADKCWTSDKAA